MGILVKIQLENDGLRRGCKIFKPNGFAVQEAQGTMLSCGTVASETGVGNKTPLLGRGKAMKARWQ